MKKNIGSQFAAVIIIAAIVLSISGSLLIWRIFTVQKSQAFELQTAVGQRLKNEFILLTHEVEDRSSTVVKLYNLLDLTPEKKNNVLSKIRSHKDKMHHDIIDEIVLYDSHGQIVSFSSRINIYPDRQKFPWKEITKRFASSPTVKNYYSPVEVAETGEPFLIFAVPITNFQTGQIEGVLASRIRINLVWEELVRTPIGKNGLVYITDQDGRIISHPNPSIVLKGAVAETSATNNFFHDSDGKMVLRSVENVEVGGQFFSIVADRPVTEALALTIQAVISLVCFLLLFIVAGMAAGIFFSKKIIQPIESLAGTAQKIRDGDLSCLSSIDSDNEIGFLARSFDNMTQQLTSEIAKLKKAEEALIEYQSGLEQKISEKTSRLENLLRFTRELSRTRDIKLLYKKSVEAIKSLLGLDFSTIMILSKDQKQLTIQETIGFPESTIGTFSLVIGQGLSTYVVKKKKAATVLNFNTETRFDVPPLVFLHDIKSAISVPMMIDNDIFGVIIGHTVAERHFSEDEIAICQSLANQIAVVLDNATHLQEVYASELKFKELFDNTNDAILVYDLNGSLLEVNKITCERLQYSRDELLNSPPSTFIAPQYAATLQERIKLVKTNKKEMLTTVHLTKSGEEIPIELSCTMIDFEGQSAILGIARDIRERKKIEEEQLKNRKLESVGILAGGIAHDFNNILAAIIGNINLAAMRVADDNDTHEILISAEQAALRARDLTQQLLTFAKGGEPIKKVSSIAEIIKDSADFVLRGKNIKCIYSFAEHLWPAAIDAGQISQVVQNIVINACEAMQDGGFIEITCRNIDEEGTNKLPLEIGQYVMISIKDSGPGITEDIIGRIFDPYFTTKEEGSGLGLAITHSIITKHEGVISAESSKDRGTNIVIYLKASPHLPLKVESISEQSIATFDRKIRVLVMDDDQMVRKVTDGLLSKLGYEVLLAADGQKAVDIYKNQTTDEPIDVIIMDLTIPGGMGGKDAVREILQINPGAKVIVSSGYSNDPIMANYQDYGFCAAIIKPYQINDLDRIIKQTAAG